MAIISHMVQEDVITLLLVAYSTGDIYSNSCSFMIADTDLENLQRDMRARRQHAFRPGTSANQWSQWKLFISFCIHFNFRAIEPQ